MKKLLFVVLFAFGCFFAAQAQQNYKSAIGLRLGYPISVSYKTFISEPGAIEVFAGFRSWNYYSWFNVGALYQHHFAITSVEGLDWYVGGGASAYFELQRSICRRWRHFDHFRYSWQPWP